MPFTDEELYQAVDNNLHKVSAYVSSHGGNIHLLGVKDAIIYIELGGTCHGCSMSLMTTKMVVRRELRELIHPELDVINVDGTLNALPDDCYREEVEPVVEVEKEGLFDKVKKIFST